jgi:hypothetical protein
MSHPLSNWFLPCGLLLVFALPSGLDGQSTWTVSNIPGSDADFSGLPEAFDSGQVEAGDSIEIVASGISYGSVEISIPVTLRGASDPTDESRFPAIHELVLLPDSAPGGAHTVLEDLVVDRLTLHSGNLSVARCKMGSIQITGTGTTDIRSSWIHLTGTESLSFESSGELLLEGNLLTLTGPANAIYTSAQSEAVFRQNTIVDDSGRSEWLVYSGNFTNNLLTVSEARLATFDVMFAGNISSRARLPEPENLNGQTMETMLLLDSETTRAYLPKAGGAAIGGGTGGLDVGFTGGPDALDLDGIPGSGRLVDIPPPPSIDALNAGAGDLEVLWSISEPVEGFEVQMGPAGGAFTELRQIAPDKFASEFTGLEENEEFQVRVRSFRDGLESDWVESEPVRTLASVPPAPELITAEFSEAEAGVNLEWVVEEVVDSFELQWAVNGTAFGNPVILQAEVAGTIVTDLEEGSEVEFRLRSIRNDMVSDWVVSPVLQIPVSDNPLTFYREILGDSTEQLGDWFESDWLGWFTDEGEGQIFHLEHGYLYVIGNPDSVFVFDYALGYWFWTSETFYPNLYLYQEPAQWYLFYRGTSRPERYFYQYVTDTNLREDEI